MDRSKDERYVVEVGGRSVGVLLVDPDRRFTFFAATEFAFKLDRQRFRSLAAAHRAVRKLIQGEMRRLAG